MLTHDTTFKTFNCCLKEGSHIRIGVTKGVKTKLRRDDSKFKLKSFTPYFFQGNISASSALSIGL